MFLIRSFGIGCWMQWSRKQFQELLFCFRTQVKKNSTMSKTGSYLVFFNEKCWYIFNVNSAFLKRRYNTQQNKDIMFCCDHRIICKNSFPGYAIIKIVHNSTSIQLLKSSMRKNLPFMISSANKVCDIVKSSLHCAK